MSTVVIQPHFGQRLGVFVLAEISSKSHLEQQYMRREMVEARRTADKVEQCYDDLFSGLLDAMQDKPGSDAGLSE